MGPVRPGGIVWGRVRSVNARKGRGWTEDQVDGLGERPGPFAHRRRTDTIVAPVILSGSEG